MKFKEVIDALEQGKQIRRKNQGIFIRIDFCGDHNFVAYQEGSHELSITRTLPIASLFADDWEIVDEPTESEIQSWKNLLSQISPLLKDKKIHEIFDIDKLKKEAKFYGVNLDSSDLDITQTRPEPPTLEKLPVESDDYHGFYQNCKLSVEHIDLLQNQRINQLIQALESQGILRTK